MMDLLDWYCSTRLNLSNYINKSGDWRNLGGPILSMKFESEVTFSEQTNQGLLMDIFWVLDLDFVFFLILSWCALRSFSTCLRDGSDGNTHFGGRLHGITAHSWFVCTWGVDRFCFNDFYIFFGDACFFFGPVGCLLFLGAFWMLRFLGCMVFFQNHSCN